MTPRDQCQWQGLWFFPLNALPHIGLRSRAEPDNRQSVADIKIPSEGKNSARLYKVQSVDIFQPSAPSGSDAAL